MPRSQALPGNAPSSRLCRPKRGRASHAVGYEAEPRNQSDSQAEPGNEYAKDVESSGLVSRGDGWRVAFLPGRETTRLALVSCLSTILDYSLFPAA